MNTSHPEMVSDDEILQAIDGEAPPEVLHHLDTCPICAQRRRDFERFELRLSQAAYRLDCPAPEELGAYALNALPSERRRAVREHLTGCSRCADELAIFGRGLRAAAPAVRTEPVRWTGWHNSLHALPATLPQSFAGDEPGYIFESTVATFTLSVHPAADGWKIEGEILADDHQAWVGALIEARRNNELAGVAVADDLALFEVVVAGPGRIDLFVIAPGGLSVVLPTLELA